MRWLGFGAIIHKWAGHMKYAITTAYKARALKITIEGQTEEKGAQDEGEEEETSFSGTNFSIISLNRDQVQTQPDF